MKVNKTDIRIKMKKRRKKFFSESELAPWTASKFFLSKLLTHFSEIAVYWPIKYELDTRPLIKTLLINKKKILLPCIFKNNLFFKNWNNEEILNYNKLGFYEPDFQLKSFTPQIVLVPLLAFDNQGNRLGYGGGFYDRFYNNNKNIVYVGYGFSFQQVQKIPSNNYDLKLSYIVTDSYIKKVV